MSKHDPIESMQPVTPDLKVVQSVHEPGDVFRDLAALRKKTVLKVTRKVVKVNVTVSHKPPPGCYFRVNSDPEMQLDANILKSTSEEMDSTLYYVVPGMETHPKLALRVRPVTIAMLYHWPRGVSMLWTVPILGARRKGKDPKVWVSARRAYELAKAQWMQLTWDENESDYKVEPAENIDKIEPVWPEESFNELLMIAFAGNIIDSENHPYVKELRGVLD